MAMRGALSASLGVISAFVGFRSIFSPPHLSSEAIGWGGFVFIFSLFYPFLRKRISSP
jgi:hypothetical protein